MNMNLQISSLINRNFTEIRNNNNKKENEFKYYIKVEIGKFVSSNIFENISFQDELIDYLNINYSLICDKDKEYYQYQYQNQTYQRTRDFKSVSFINNLIDLENFKSSNGDYRISLHQEKSILLFGQHMNYHNIIFIKEKGWKISDECNIYLIESKKNIKNDQRQIYFKINVPLSEHSINNIVIEINKLNKFFKHKCDKKYTFHSLYSVVESEQPLQELNQDKQPLDHPEECSED